MRHWLLTILCFFIAYICAYAQEEEYAPRTYVDTIQVEKNTLVIGADSIYFMRNDTVIYIQDTVRSKIEALLRQHETEHEKEFYENLAKEEDSSLLRKKIIELLIESKKEEEPSEEELEEEKEKDLSTSSGQDKTIDINGKILGNISIQGLEVFGPSVNDTASDKTSGISRFANKIHSYTREHIIRNRLLLKRGDELSAAQLLDNERILRALPYIRDARFVIESVNGDTVNLLLLTQDLIAYTASAEPSGLDGGRVDLNNINVLGYGHQLYNSVRIDTERQRKFGYIGEYHMPNIGTTQTQGILSYQNTEYEQNYRLSLDRSFLTPGIRFAGGVFLEHRRAFTYAPWISSYEELYAFEHEEEIPRHLHKSFTQDYWVGRSFKPDFITRYDSRARLVMALRYHHKKYTERPPVTNDAYKAFHNRHLFLMSVGFSRSNFTTERQVYGYGITEDIPLGETAEIVLGPEKGEFYNRFFTGIRLTKGKYIPPVGYLSAGFRLGGYWYKKQLEDGVLQFTANTFSYPILWKRTTYRLFFNADYSQGIQPIDKENFWENMVSLNDEEGVRGLRSYRMFGYQRLAFSLETVAYLPLNFYSFRMATFAFADAGTIAQRDETLLEGRFYQGYGIGFRIRNDRLAFKTFELRLAGYPAPPVGESAFKISISGIPVPRLLDFNIRKPDTFNFQ